MDLKEIANALREHAYEIEDVRLEFFSQTNKKSLSITNAIDIVIREKKVDYVGITFSVNRRSEGSAKCEWTIYDGVESYFGATLEHAVNQCIGKEVTALEAAEFVFASSDQ